jgi:paraquat-inducible protein B
MSAKPNATVVGIFVLGSLAFSILGLVFLGQAAFSRSSYRFVTYFDETVSGLEIGAAVKFRGVKIGQVSDLKIFLAETGGEGVSSRIPVIYEVETKRFKETFGDLIDLSKPDELRRYIDGGLRARLATSSFITGLMYVELDIVDPEEYPSEYYSQFAELYEIPNFKGTLAELSDNVSDFIKRFNSVDFQGISLRVIDLLENLNAEVQDADLGNLSESLQSTAHSFQALAELPEIPKLMEDLQGTLGEYKTLAGDLRSSIDQTATELQKALQQMAKTLESLEVTTTSLHVMVRPQSSVRTNLDEALVSLSAAAESLRSLTDYLERNPSALIRGRQSSVD